MKNEQSITCLDLIIRPTDVLKVFVLTLIIAFLGIILLPGWLLTQLAWKLGRL